MNTRVESASAVTAPRAIREVTANRPIEVYALSGFLFALVCVAALLSPTFLSAANIRDILTQAAPLGFAVLGQAIVIMVRGLDLSVASVMATVAVLATSFNASSDAMIPLIFLAALLLAGTVGLVNGWLVAKRGVSPFLATLAVMIVLQGLRFAYTQGAPAGTLPTGFRWLGTGVILGVPVNIVALALVAVAFGLMLHRTTLGRRFMMVGGNPRAADLVGVRSDRITILAYVLGSMMAGLAGLFLVGYVGTVDNWVGRGYELDSIVAAIIGGVALTGGAGTIPGALLGALVLMVLFNIVVILGLPIELQLIIKGLVIVLAAAIHMRRVEGR
jgi:ribose transport system permease protein/inositol transport system permease protein